MHKFKIAKLERVKGGALISIGNDYKLFRKDSILYCPRAHQFLLVMETPKKSNFRVFLDFMPEYYVDVSDVARIFKVSNKTVLRWCKDGIIAAEKVKGKWRIDKAMNDTWPENVGVGDELALIIPGRNNGDQLER